MKADEKKTREQILEYMEMHPEKFIIHPKEVAEYYNENIYWMIIVTKRMLADGTLEPCLNPNNEVSK